MLAVVPTVSSFGTFFGFGFREKKRGRRNFCCFLGSSKMHLPLMENPFLMWQNDVYMWQSLPYPWFCTHEIWWMTSWFGPNVQFCRFSPRFVAETSLMARVFGLETPCSFWLWKFKCLGVWLGLWIYIYGWWFQTFFMFHNIWGIILPIDSYFSRWLKPPTIYI